MSWKEFASDYLTFNRRDRIAIVVILSLILLIFILPDFFLKQTSSKQTNNDTAWIASLKKLEKKETENGNNEFNRFNDDNSSNYQYDRPLKDYRSAKGTLFYFDPNTLSTEGWQKLGLRDKTIHTIQNYLSKGGHFRKPEDLQKIYGLFPNEYERIAPYIKIADVVETGNKEFTNMPVTENQPTKTYTSRYSVIDINTADTTAFISLPGIGSKLAVRIINFREKLGGFYSISQVGETFGLPDSTFQKIKQYLKLENAAVKKININTATIDELKAHPYIKWSIANPIVAYRNEHGLFTKIEDIKKVMAVTEEIYTKIFPYLTTQ
ncbi:MAG: helix-hairpin-helix domain-containing protein [Sphingobacteriales bacterium]|nr:helix-hairpin-helix domain-containing protein [Sphingobacteriales bacterium]